MILVFGKPMCRRTNYIKENYISKFTVVVDPCIKNDYKDVVPDYLIYKDLTDDLVDRFIKRYDMLQEKTLYNVTYNKSHNIINPTIIIDDLTINEKLIMNIKKLLECNANIVITTIDKNIMKYIKNFVIVHETYHFTVYTINF